MIRDSRKLRRLAIWLIRRRRRLLVLGIAVTLLAVPTAGRLAYDQSIESLYSSDDPLLKDFQDSRALFGGDEFVVVAYSDPHLFDGDGKALTEDGERRVRKLADQLAQAPGVDPNSIQHVAKALKFRFGRKRVRRMIEDVLVGRDNQATAIVMRLIPQSRTEIPRDDVIAGIRRIAADDDSPVHEVDSPVYVVGEPVQISDMFRIVREDSTLLFRVSLCLLSIVILFLFRSVRWVLLPVLLVVMTIVWTKAILVIADTRLSMVGSMLYSMVTIIGIATVVHVGVHYRRFTSTMRPQQALLRTLEELAMPVFWSCSTTAVGFAALLCSQVNPVRSFGLMVALAAMLVLIVAALILPGGILMGRHAVDPGPTSGEDRLARILRGVSTMLQTRPVIPAASGLAAFLLALPGVFLLQVETDFTRNFREDTPIVQSLMFVEARLGGAGMWEVKFPAPPDLTDEFLDRVRLLSSRLRDVRDENGEPPLKVASLTDGLDTVPRIPKITNTMSKRLRMLDRLQQDFASNLYNPEEGVMRIVLRSRERQESETKLRLIRHAQELAEEVFGTTDGSEEGARPATATGIFVLLAFVIQSLLNDQLVSFSWAAFGICGMITIAFRSLRIGLVSLVPNFFPIVLVIGSMGLLGVPVNIGTAMIASVSMGLTVDSTIHYTAAFERHRRAFGLDEALARSHQSVGRALIYSHLALIVGFLVLMLSQFTPLAWFGMLLSLAMFGGLLGDLFLLPLLLKWIHQP